MATVIWLNCFPNDKVFRLVQIESICRQGNKYNLKTEIVFGMGKKIVGKGENAGYQHFLLFPQCFQKDCVVSD